MLIGPFSTAALTGADASGAGSVTTPLRVRGLLYSVYLSHTGDDPDTTDITIATQGTSPVAPSYTLLSRANSHANEMLYPRADGCKASDASALSQNNILIPIDDYVTMTVAQGNTGDIWSMWLFVLPVSG